MCEAASSSQRVIHASFTAAGDSSPGGDSGRAGRREGMKQLMHVLPV